MKSEKLFDKFAEKYDYLEEIRHASVYRHTLELTRKYISEKDKILDIGCATGNKALDMAKTASFVKGIDTSSKMVEAAITKSFRRNITNVSFMQTGIFDWMLDEEKFDIITAFDVLHLLFNESQVVQRILNLLKPGGIFISLTPCLKEKTTFITRFRLIMMRLSGNQENSIIFSKYTFQELESLFKTGSFQVLEKQMIFHNYSSLFVVAKKI